MAIVEFFHSGLSMSPVLAPGDVVLVDTEYGCLERGDIILYRDIDSYDFVAHRLIIIDPMTTKGDFTITQEIVDVNQIFGKVIARKRNQQIFYFSTLPVLYLKFRALLSSQYLGKYPRLYRGFFKLLLKIF